MAGQFYKKYKRRCKKKNYLTRRAAKGRPPEKVEPKTLGENCDTLNHIGKFRLPGPNQSQCRTQRWVYMYKNFNFQKNVFFSKHP